jgi:hypothetical protein
MAENQGLRSGFNKTGLKIHPARSFTVPVVSPWM